MDWIKIIWFCWEKSSHTWIKLEKIYHLDKDKLALCKLMLHQEEINSFNLSA
jgi:hypothetical protein